MFEPVWLCIAFWLAVAHYVADFPLQGDFLAANKGKRWYLMAAHCFIWSGVCGVPLAAFGLLAAWKLAFLFVGHYICDNWKSRQPKDDAHWHLIYFDQSFHAFQLALVALIP